MREATNRVAWTRAAALASSHAYSPRTLACPAGALAGAVECCTVQPLDIVKTRHQLNPGVNSGVMVALKSLVREGGARRCASHQPDDGWSQTHRPALGAPECGFSVFRAMQSAAARHLRALFSLPPCLRWSPALSGVGVAGAGGNPCSPSSRTRGFRRLYRGLLPEVAGGMPRSSAMYAGFAAAQRHLIQLNGGVSSAPVAFAAGAVSGIPEAMVATPFQVCDPSTSATLVRFSHVVSAVVSTQTRADHNAHSSFTICDCEEPRGSLRRPPGSSEAAPGERLCSPAASPGMNRVWCGVGFLTVEGAPALS